MHNSKIKRISLAVCFALMPMAASAAGLGKLTVISSLGEPLNAEVELSASQDELSSISARMASSEVFAEQGLERASSLSGVKIELGRRPDGTPILKLASSQPISDPFLDMLIQVEWSSGRLLREYTALLDPPGYGDKVDMSSPMVNAPAELPSTSPVKKGSKSKARVSADATASPATEMPGDVTVRRGDTLHAIALANQVEGVSLEQMLVGLYRANKDAFAGANMNRLKVGQIIHVPPQEELQAVAQQEAAKEIRVQAADWNAYRSKLAGLVAESAPAQEVAPSQSTSGKITAPAQDKSLPEPAGPRDVVKLSKSESGDVKGRLTALQEEATAREKAIKESGERVAMLEKQLQDMQKLLELKNKTLADAQSAAKPAPAAPVEPPKPAEPTKAAEPPKAIEPKPEPAAPVEEKKPEPPVAATPEHKAKPEAKKPKRKIARPAPPPPEPGLLDDPLGNPMVLGGLGGLLALVGGVWFYMRNKRRKGLDSFEQGILTSGGLKPNTVFGNTAGGTVDTGNTSFLTDFSQGTASGMIDTNDVDPIAEAEVYMAYGRDVQAEEILKDAISKEPKRYELHLKLLEIYSGRKDNGAFETLAGELYATLGATDPTWAKVAELGRKLEPDNPLYGSNPAHTASPVAEEVDFDATMIQQPPAGDEGAAGIDVGLGGPDTTLDFSLDEAAAPEAPVEDNNALDFDIGALEAPGETASEAAAESLPEIESSAMDLDFPLGDDASATAALEMPSPGAEAETAGLDFQLDLPEPAAESSVQLDMAELGQAETVDAENVAELSLDLGALEMPAPEGMDAAIALESEATADLSMPDLEMPEIDGSTEASSDSVPALDVEELSVPSLELPETSSEEALEIPQLDEIPSDSALDLTALEASEVSADAPVLDAVEELEMPSLDLPDSDNPVSDIAPMESAESSLGVSLDIPEISAQETSDQELSMDVALELPDPGLTEENVSATEEISLDLPSMEIPSESAISLDVDLDEPAVASDLDDLEKTLMLNVPIQESVETESAEPQNESAASASVEGLDFDFDVDLGGADQADGAPIEIAAQGAVPELDLSGISLDVGDAASVNGDGSEEITLSSGESPDVDTKLDLVTAYIDMGDAEGARELLQEVMQEGGPAQREKAQKLLESLD